MGCEVGGGPAGRGRYIMYVALLLSWPLDYQIQSMPVWAPMRQSTHTHRPRNRNTTGSSLELATTAALQHRIRHSTDHTTAMEPTPPCRLALGMCCPHSPCMHAWLAAWLRRLQRGHQPAAAARGAGGGRPDAHAAQCAHPQPGRHVAQAPPPQPHGLAGGERHVQGARFAVPTCTYQIGHPQSCSTG